MWVCMYTHKCTVKHFILFHKIEVIQTHVYALCKSVKNSMKTMYLYKTSKQNPAAQSCKCCKMQKFVSIKIWIKTRLAD